METILSPKLVAIKCHTYNHKPYIQDALNGFVTQKTTFPYIIILVDDASTDGEPEVINKYIQEQFDISDKVIAYTKETEDALYTYARHLHNKNCYIIYLQLKINLYRNPRKSILYSEWLNEVKYIAICEGDDYWIDSNKLQKQVDFMDKNDEYGLIYGKSRIYNETTKKYYADYGSEKGQTFAGIFSGMTIPTATALYRKNLFEKCTQFNVYAINNGLFADWSIWLWFAYYSKIKFIDEILCVYREAPNSATHSTDDNKLISIAKQGSNFTVFHLLLYELNTQEEKDSVRNNVMISINRMIDDVYLLGRCHTMKTKTYKIGHALISPIRMLKKIFIH